MTKEERSKLMKRMWQNPNHKKRMSKAHKGQHSSPTTQFKKGQNSWNKGIRGSIPSIIGKNSHKWKGGKFIHSSGYVLIYKPNHPYARKKHVFEHRLAMEKYLSRYLTPKEVVHHINEIRTDNRLKNLMLFANKGDHTNYHRLH